MTGVCDPSTEGNLLCRARKDEWATASLGSDETWPRSAPPPLAAGLAGAGAVCVGLVAATRACGSVAGAAGAPRGESDNGVLALALAEDGAGRGGGFAAAPGFVAGGAGAAAAGAPVLA